MLNALSASDARNGAVPAPASSCFVADTSALSARRRAEEVLGLPILASKVWSTLQTIAPAEAKQLLLAMEPQRVVRQTWVSKLASDMKAARWHFTHQGIAFDEGGHLIDGQHRLLAIVESGCAVELMVTFNVPKSSFKTMDRHQRRNVADDLVTSATTDRKLAKLIASCIRPINNYDAGVLPWSNGAEYRASFDMAEAVIARHPLLSVSAEYTYAKSHRSIVPAPTLAAFGCLFMERNQNKALSFLDQITIGDGLVVGDPAWAFRDMLFRERDLRAKNTPSVMMGIVRAWNAFVEGRRLNKIDTSIRGDGFPEISKGK